MRCSFSRRHSKLLTILGATGLAGLGSSDANADILFDLRATGSTGGFVANNKLFVLSSPGDTVTLGLYARVSGTDGNNNEGFNSAYGLINSVGGMKGNLAGSPVVPFRDSSFQNGSVVDWDSDGDLDIGLSPTNSSGTGKLFARNATAGGLPMQVNVDTNAGESLIAQFIWTYTGGGVDAALNFTLRNNNGNAIDSAALWFEDGATVSKNATNSTVSIGPPVVHAPEPSSIGALALASIGLLKRRRNR